MNNYIGLRESEKVLERKWFKHIFFKKKKKKFTKHGYHNIRMH